MNDSRVWIAIAIMALVTYLPRMLPLTIFQKKIRNRFMKSFLTYVPYAVLAAMTFPAIFYATAGVSGQSGWIAIVSAVAGTLMALLLAIRKKGLLTVALGSAAVLFVVEWILQYLGNGRF